jgi:hypothetical protein
MYLARLTPQEWAPLPHTNTGEQEHRSKVPDFRSSVV